MENLNEKYTSKSDLWGFYFALRPICLYLIIVSLGFYFDNIYIWLFVSFSLSFFFLSFFSLLHWSIHNVLFRTRWLNFFFGRLFALLTLDLFSGYKYWHYAHHELVSTQINQERENSDRFDDVFNLKTYILALLKYFLNPILKFSDYYNVIYKNNSNKERFYLKNINQFRIDFILYLAFVFLLLVSMILYTKIVFFIYFLPLIISLPFIFFLDIARHHDTNPNGKDEFEKTRCIEGNFFTNFLTVYANLHLEHHLFHKVPPQYILIVHRNIQDKIIYRADTYFSYNISLIKKYTHKEVSALSVNKVL